MSKSKEQQRVQVEMLLKLIREYVVDVAVLAVLRARKYERKADGQAEPDPLGGVITATEAALESKGKELVAAIEQQVGE